MADHMDHLDDHGLPAWVREELRRPVRTDGAGKARLMMRVRAATPPWRTLGPRPAWRTRRGLASLAGLAAAAGFAVIATAGAVRGPLALSGIQGSAGTALAAAAVLHDTVTGIAGPRAAGALVPGGLATTIGDSLLRDTLRLVRFAIAVPRATRLALLGDFNAWDPKATPMLALAESTGTWVATVALRPGTHRYAFVVDDSQWVADPAAPRVAGDSGRVLSTITVPAARN